MAIGTRRVRRLPVATGSRGTLAFLGWAIAIEAARLSPNAFAVCALLVVAKLGQLIADERRLRLQIDSTPTLLRSLEELATRGRVRIVLDERFEIDCDQVSSERLQLDD